jgi:hypothetical protein
MRLNLRPLAAGLGEKRRLEGTAEDQLGRRPVQAVAGITDIDEEVAYRPW